MKGEMLLDENLKREMAFEKLLRALDEVANMAEDLADAFEALARNPLVKINDAGRISDCVGDLRQAGRVMRTIEVMYQYETKRAEF